MHTSILLHSRNFMHCFMHCYTVQHIFLLLNVEQLSGVSVSSLFGGIYGLPELEFHLHFYSLFWESVKKSVLSKNSQTQEKVNEFFWSLFNWLLENFRKTPAIGEFMDFHFSALHQLFQCGSANFLELVNQSWKYSICRESQVQ